MMLITITNWKQKATVVVKLLFFLLLIGLLIPQLLIFITGGLADVKDEKSYYMRVEQEAADKPAQDNTFLESLQQFYYGEESGTSR
jgi:hypothetical protein